MMVERPSRRGNRPSALDVAFGTDDADDSATTSDASRKRDRGDEAGGADLRVRAWIFPPVILTSGPVFLLEYETSKPRWSSTAQ